MQHFIKTGTKFDHHVKNYTGINLLNFLISYLTFKKINKNKKKNSKATIVEVNSYLLMSREILYQTVNIYNFRRIIVNLKFKFQMIKYLRVRIQ